MHTAQSIFNAIWTRMRAQGILSSYVGDGPMRRCRYRAPGGRACAAGSLLPDDLYCEGIEGETARQLIASGEFGSAALSARLLPFSGLIGNLQVAHDNANGPEDMEQRLRAVALLENLEVPSV